VPVDVDETFKNSECLSTQDYYVQPICIYKEKRVAEKAYVMGWGNTKTNYCKTLMNGPQPNAKCKFPFLDKSGREHRQCTSNVHWKLEAYAGKVRKGDSGQYRYKDEKGVLRKTTVCKLIFKQLGNDPWKDVDYVRVQGIKGKMIKKCYAPAGRRTIRDKKWCATCIPFTKKGDVGYCDPERYLNKGGDDVLKKDKSMWGFCDVNIDHCNSGRQSTSASNRLQEAELRVLKKASCEEKIGKLQNFDKKHEMCTVGAYKRTYRTVATKQEGRIENNYVWIFDAWDEKGKETERFGSKDACQGDSGGPLAQYRGGKFAQIGIVSRGSGCADNNIPGIFTDVFAHKYWITRFVKKKYRKCKISKD